MAPTPLYLEDFSPGQTFASPSADEIRWPRPTRPGDTLRLVTEVLELRPSKSRPDEGLMKVRTTTFNQNDEPVQVMVSNLVVPRGAG